MATECLLRVLYGRQTPNLSEQGIRFHSENVATQGAATLCDIEQLPALNTKQSFV